MPLPVLVLLWVFQQRVPNRPIHVYSGCIYKLKKPLKTEQILKLQAAFQHNRCWQYNVTFSTKVGSPSHTKAESKKCVLSIQTYRLNSTRSFFRRVASIIISEYHKISTQNATRTKISNLFLSPTVAVDLFIRINTCPEKGTPLTCILNEYLNSIKIKLKYSACLYCTFSSFVLPQP